MFDLKKFHDLGHLMSSATDTCLKCGKYIPTIMAYENYCVDPSLTNLTGLSGWIPTNTKISLNCGYKCECGSETCGSPMHSDWCPKYEK